MISDAQARQMVERWGSTQPGKRGVDIPAEIFDRIAPAAHGAMLPLYGRPATPEQLQWFHDQGITEPADVHDAVSRMQHPHAPDLTVGEFPRYQQAFDTFRAHR